MARPLSEDKRNAIMAAAARIIVTQGLTAPTAVIAREAGVANGSLFTYFETKADLLNQLYLDLKVEMAFAATRGVLPRAELRDQMCRLWQNWMSWATAHPHKRRALVQLVVSEDLTAATRATGHQIMAPVAELIERCRANGPMKHTPKGFVISLMNSMADATMDFMIHDPPNAKKHCKAGFEAVWRAIA